MGVNSEAVKGMITIFEIYFFGKFNMVLLFPFKS